MGQKAKTARLLLPLDLYFDCLMVFMSKSMEGAAGVCAPGPIGRVFMSKSMEGAAGVCASDRTGRVSGEVALELLIFSKLDGGFGPDVWGCDSTAGRGSASIGGLRRIGLGQRERAGTRGNNGDAHFHGILHPCLREVRMLWEADDRQDAGATGTRENKRRSMFRELFCLPMASVLPIGRNGDFGTSPFLGSSQSS